LCMPINGSLQVPRPAGSMRRRGEPDVSSPQGSVLPHLHGGIGSDDSSLGDSDSDDSSTSEWNAVAPCVHGASPLDCDPDVDAYDDFDADPCVDAVVWPDVVLDPSAAESPSAGHWQTPSLTGRSQSHPPSFSPGATGSPFLCSPAVPHTPGSALPPPAAAMHDGSPPPDTYHDGPVVWPVTCCVCNAAEHNGDGSRLLCEMKACGRSYHVVCLPHRERGPASRCISQGKRWCCHFCRPAASQDSAAAHCLLYQHSAHVLPPAGSESASRHGVQQFKAVQAL
jgi:hypothetical protein